MFRKVWFNNDRALTMNFSIDKGIKVFVGIISKQGGAYDWKNGVKYTISGGSIKVFASQMIDVVSGKTKATSTQTYTDASKSVKNMVFGIGNTGTFKLLVSSGDMKDAFDFKTVEDIADVAQSLKCFFENNVIVGMIQDLLAAGGAPQSGNDGEQPGGFGNNQQHTNNGMSEFGGHTQQQPQQQMSQQATGLFDSIASAFDSLPTSQPQQQMQQAPQQMSKSQNEQVQSDVFGSLF